jgi:hypothetical protein
MKGGASRSKFMALRAPPSRRPKLIASTRFARSGLSCTESASSFGLVSIKTRPAKSWGSGGELKLVIIGPRQFNWLWQAAITFETSVEMSGPDVEHQLSA